MREEPSLTDHLIIYYLTSYLAKPILSVSPWGISHLEKAPEKDFRKMYIVFTCVLYVKINNEAKWDTDSLQEHHTTDMQPLKGIKYFLSQVETRAL